MDILTQNKIIDMDGEKRTALEAANILLKGQFDNDFPCQ
jgi:hypothetical protein